MLDGLLWLPALGVFALLLLFAARRVIFTLTLRHPQPPLPAAGRLPSVLLLVPIHNEAASLPHLFGALGRLDYPRDRVRVVLIDDGSTDASAALLAGAAAQRPDWQLLRLPRNVGKAQALNEALATHDFGEVIYIFDADHRPRPDCLRVAVTAFSDPQVAAVSGRTLISNP